MEAYPYDYDRNLPWTPQQNQFYQRGPAEVQDSQHQFPEPQNLALPKQSGVQKPKVPQKMPKAQAQALANTLKRWLAVASFVGFGTFGGLVALHQVGATAVQTTQSSSGSSNISSTSSSSSQNSNNFLNQQGGNTSGTSSSSTSNSSSTPVTGTRTS